MFVYHTDHTR